MDPAVHRTSQSQLRELQRTATGAVEFARADGDRRSIIAAAVAAAATGHAAQRLQHGLALLQRVGSDRIALPIQQLQTPHGPRPVRAAGGQVDVTATVDGQTRCLCPDHELD